MIKSFLFLLALLSLPPSITAQSITGKVIDTANIPVEFANVALYALPDSVLITGAVTDQRGEFSLNPNGNAGKPMYLQISFIGYQTKTVAATPGQTIVLDDDSRLLGEVVVSANRKIFRVENGSMVADVKNTVLETLANAGEVVAQLPFLSAKEGEYTVFGRGTPAIYINNRLVRDNRELEQLPPSEIKNIQVITSPGAAYDATVRAVIKITTERPVGEGLSGTLYAQGRHSSVFSNDEYVSLNYRAGAWDFFGLANYEQYRYKVDIGMDQHMSLPGSEHRQIYKTDQKGGYNRVYSFAGLNYNPNKNHSAGIRYTYDNLKWDNKVANDIVHTPGSSAPERINQLAVFKTPSVRHNLNAYYNGAVSEKLSLTVNADIVSGNEKDEMEAGIAGSPDDILHTRGTREHTLYAAKGIMSYNAGNGLLDVGAEYTHTRVLQSYGIDDPGLGIDNTDDKAVQNRGALFASYNRQFGNFTLNAGLRYENIVMDYFQNGLKNDEQSKKYNKLFPNISLTYANGDFQTVAGYERKVSYPSYYQLRSNIQYSSPFAYESGNPLLQPEIGNQLSVILAWKTLQAMAGYSINENKIYSIPQQFKDQAIILLRDENIKTGRSANIGLSYSPAFGLWRPRLEAGMMWQRLKLEDIGKDYDKPVFNGKWLNTLSFPRQWTLRADASGRLAGHNGVMLMRPSWGVDLRVTKRFLADRLSVLLAANDIFKTNTQKWEMDYGKINIFYDKNIDSRSVSLTITYQFNPTTDKYKGQQASDEINRL